MTEPLVLDGWDVGALPWQRASGVPGARLRPLWESPRSRAVLLLLEAGTSFPAHLHPDEEHHAYVVRGRCRVGARLLGEGSYVHIPPGERHDIHGEAPAGATVLYVFERGAP